MFMSSMVWLFSLVERLNILFNEAKPGWIDRMLYISTNENNRTIERMEKHSLFVLYNTKVDLLHLIGG